MKIKITHEGNDLVHGAGKHEFEAVERLVVVVNDEFKIYLEQTAPNAIQIMHTTWPGNVVMLHSSSNVFELISTWRQSDD